MRVPRCLEVWKMGSVNYYLDAHKIQDKLVSDRRAHKISDTLLSLQHPPTCTLANVELILLGAQLHYTQRGLDITYHGPHQAILRPILSTDEIGETVVWIGERKIGAIGVRIQSEITSHGLAFNIGPDLSCCKHIVPCGILTKLSHP
ncbi:hypothetical protein Nepgr_001923 [Nepenthes gracilis]|uniref:lipoyl(octanoyl) transferase n=1 Tax=Nepenthes gracilis TaxID=150966 RepID=A0AAD3P8Z5_NEPGR|nr:hypothetical protein Nepgr_001923 [Nepenthes gracilis]